MALTSDDVRRIAALFTPLEKRTESVETEIAKLRKDMLSGFERLFSENEKRENEYTILNKQNKRLDKRVDDLEKKVA